MFAGRIRPAGCAPLDYTMIVIYLKLLAIYITNLYWWKISTFFILSKDEILVQNTPTSLNEKNTGWHQWTIIFCGYPHGTDPPSKNQIRPPEPDSPFPLCGCQKRMAPKGSCRLQILSAVSYENEHKTYTNSGKAGDQPYNRTDVKKSWQCPNLRDMS